jgi:hypothetical protein
MILIQLTSCCRSNRRAFACALAISCAMICDAKLDLVHVHDNDDAAASADDDDNVKSPILLMGHWGLA